MKATYERPENGIEIKETERTRTNNTLVLLTQDSFQDVNSGRVSAKYWRNIRLSYRKNFWA